LPTLLVVACGGDRAGAPRPSNPPAPAALAVQLGGPYPDVAAYCAERDRDGALCEPLAEGSDPTPSEVPSFHEVTPMVVETDQDLLGCAIAIRTDAGWFVTTPSEAPCREPSYIDITGVRVEPENDGVVSVSFEIVWHTKDGDDEASYTISALCGDAGGRAACTPMFVSACEAHAPAGDCLDAGYALSWTIADGAVTITSDRALDGDTATLIGTHRLF
jgi:hypothetical protein